jgi:hypothetical protein
VDLEEQFDVFYDFSKDTEEFLRTGVGNHKTKRRAKKRVDVANIRGSCCKKSQRRTLAQ